MKDDTLVKARAAQAWLAMTENQRHGIRFGLFPAEVMRAAEKDGYTIREISLALMDIATKNGGMIA